MSNMMIQGLSNGGVTAGINKSSGGEAGSGGFSKVLKEAISSVNNSQNEADEMMTGLASGKHANIHETMIAMEKADISFRLATKVQGKVLEAYKEIMRIQL
ncbi:MAG: flagellar hook-basal body complex protein FliE [Desulfobulbaceae bacterium]|nr:flagellar hook-basal body complex protein FliE [Desulfobulbaceae bacterium]